MTFTNEQIINLEAPLNRAHVKQREQSGRKLSYIEGWHAIAEANRIFGFDAWSRETIDIKCVAERERKIGRPPNTKDGWGVSYTAKVRVVVGGVIREGIGAGHGIDADLGLAHESAIKEAETDAMKRAFMTFGNPFGLALYDKEMANVADAPPEESMADKYMAQCLAAIVGFDNAERLSAWWSSAENKKQRANMFGDGKNIDSIKHDAGYQKLLAAVTARIGELKHKEAA
jgi:DNA repair and recombination protein RAD52